MTKCNNCNVEMIENAKLEGQHPFELGPDGRTDISIHIPTGKQGSFLGIKYEKSTKLNLLVRVCPNCGKVELYVDIDKIRE